MGLGRGSSKKEAQQHAAKEALEKVIGKQSLILN
jgi:dsRNA-specific ribonuclease